MYGIGLRHQHFPDIQNNEQIIVDFFEIISENFINTRGRPLELVLKIRSDFPVAMHGVSLSIASTEQLNFDYLKKLKELENIIKPFIISDHMCFTGNAHSNTHNLLPFAYTNENFERIAEKINIVQDFFQRPYAFENLSAYFSLKHSEMTEAEFINKLARKTGCKLLLDLNNIYVNSFNQHFNPLDYISQIDFENVAQVHLAGFSDMGDFYFDTHSRPVHNNVWKMLKTIKNNLDKKTPILVEWDEDIPDFVTLQNEVLKAKEFMDKR